MDRRLAASLSAAWRAAIVLLTLEIAAVSALRYLTGSMAPPPPILANAYAHPFLVAHVVGGIVALLLGPLQLVPRLRARLPAVHRRAGRIYAGACMVAGPAGLMLALGTTAGPVAGLGFAIPAVLLPVFTALGVRAALERRLDVHRAWMLRSYALVSTAITLRLMLPAAGLLGFDFLPAYRVIAWAAWIANLTLVELWIRRTRLPARGYATLAAA